MKKMHLKISRNAQENTSDRAIFILIKSQKNWLKCFPVNFGRRFLRTPLQNTSGRLLLYLLINLFIYCFLLSLLRLYLTNEK